MISRPLLAALLLAVVAALGAGRTPYAVVPAQVGLIVTPAKHRPARGPSRDRTLPGKARRRARRNHR
jgi:hypothetical protein